MKMTMSNCVELKLFPCLNDYVDYCDSITKPNWNGAMQSNEGGKGFTGTESYSAASDLVRNGWTEGVRKVQKAVAVLTDGNDRFQSMHSDFDIMGCTPVVPAYLTGDPECMYNPCVSVDVPVVNIVIDVSANCGVKNKAIINRGAAILQLSAMIEESGRRVAIHVSNFSQSHGKKGEWHGNITQVKAAELDFNLHVLAYAIVHPSMLRRHSFRITEGLPKEHAHKFESGYGRSRSLKDIEGIKASIGDVDLYYSAIDSHQHQCMDIKDAMDYVEGQAREQGVI